MYSYTDPKYKLRPKAVPSQDSTTFDPFPSERSGCLESEASKKTIEKESSSLDPSYFNERGKIRLARIRFLNEYERIDLSELRRIFDAWVSYDEGFVIQEQDTKDFSKKTMGLKCSKRGNDVYRWRIKNRLRELEELANLEDIRFFNKGDLEPKTSCLFITFTYDIKKCSRDEAWNNIGIEYNRAVSWLKRRYGDLSIFRAWEAFENGYPHIHALILFKEATFKVFYDQAGDARVQEKEDLEGSWHSFIDVSAVQSFARSAGYLVKYLSKVHNRTEVKYETTLTMMWLYRKRAFGISGSFVKDLKRYRLDRLMHNSNRKSTLKEMNLEGIPLPSHKKWVFVGIFEWLEILDYLKKGQKEGLWSYELSKVPK